MYVIENRAGAPILHDVGARELAQMQADPPQGWTYRRVSGAEAHRYVKRGGLHSTDLWVDDTGRIRKAGIGC